MKDPDAVLTVVCGMCSSSFGSAQADADLVSNPVCPKCASRAEKTMVTRPVVYPSQVRPQVCLSQMVARSRGRQEPLLSGVVAGSYSTTRDRVGPSVSGVILQSPVSNCVVSGKTPEVEPLKVELDGGSRAILESLRGPVRARDEARVQARLEAFECLMAQLTAELTALRASASTTDVGERVESWFRCCGEAIELDPEHRGKKVLMRVLGTSRQELWNLQCLVYTQMSVVPTENTTCLEVRGKKKSRRDLELVMVEPFCRGMRPVHWTIEGPEREVAFYSVEVVQRTNPFPLPNRDLGEQGSESFTSIKYPEGAVFGSTFTVIDSQRDQVYLKSVRFFGEWLRHHREGLGITQEMACVDIHDLLALFFAFSKGGPSTQIETSENESVCEQGTRT